MKKRPIVVIAVLIVAILACSCKNLDSMLDKMDRKQGEVIGDVKVPDQSETDTSGKTPLNTNASETPDEDGDQYGYSTGTINAAMGNTTAAILSGGYFVCNGAELYCVNPEGNGVIRIDYDGNATLLFSMPGCTVKYLNYWGRFITDYLYFMVADVTAGDDYPLTGLTIQRVDVRTEECVPEIVAENVTDYGTGFYIRENTMYYNETVGEGTENRVDSLAKMIVDRGTIQRDENTRLIAVSADAYYKDGFECDDVTGAYCVFTENAERKTYTLGCHSKDGFLFPRTSDGRWAFSIEGRYFYYIDSVNYPVPCIVKYGIDQYSKTLQLLDTDSKATGVYAMNGTVCIEPESASDITSDEGTLYVLEEYPGVYLRYNKGRITWHNYSDDRSKTPFGMTEAEGVLLQTGSAESEEEIIYVNTEFSPYDSCSKETDSEGASTVRAEKRNKDGLLFVGEVYEYSSTGEKSGYEKTEYYYDAAGNSAGRKNTLYRYLRDVQNDGKYIFKGLSETEINASGNVTTDTDYDENGAITWHGEYTYDDNNFEICSKSTGADGEIIRWAEYERDDKGNELKVIYRNADGTVKKWEENEYDANGGLVKSTQYFGDGWVDQWLEADLDENEKTVQLRRYINTYSYVDVKGLNMRNSILNTYETVYDSSWRPIENYVIAPDGTKTELSEPYLPKGIAEAEDSYTEIPCETLKLRSNLEQPASLSQYTREFFELLLHDAEGCFLEESNTKHFRTGSVDICRYDEDNFVAFDYLVMHEDVNSSGNTFIGLGVGTVCENGIVTRFFVGYATEGLNTQENIKRAEGFDGHGSFRVVSHEIDGHKILSIEYYYTISADEEKYDFRDGTVELLLDEDGVCFVLDNVWVCQTQGGQYEYYRILNESGQVVWDYAGTVNYALDGRFTAYSTDVEIEYWYCDDFYNLGWTPCVEIRYKGVTLLFEKMALGG